jgi:hypothetical protein
VAMLVFPTAVACAPIAPIMATKTTKTTTRARVTPFAWSQACLRTATTLWYDSHPWLDQRRRGPKQPRQALTVFLRREQALAHHL